MPVLNDIVTEIKTCQKCGLSRQRTRAVPGEGAVNADIMFIGEAPGWNEDQQGRPFVGAAGHFLDEMIASIGLNRSEVYITNVVKCRPPDNRDPLPDEINHCRRYLNEQISLISPKIIVTLGRYSMGLFFPGKTISNIHGTHISHNGIIYFAMYHPAAALHQGGLRAVIKNDMQKLPRLLEEIKTEPPAGEAKQIPMF